MAQTMPDMSFGPIFVTATSQNTYATFQKAYGA